jgi:hypothetical protein
MEICINLGIKISLKIDLIYRYKRNLENLIMFPIENLKNI